jgi:hypothetical protein
MHNLSPAATTQQAIEAPALAATAHSMEAGFRHSSSLTRDGNTQQLPPFTRISSINSNTSSQTAAAAAAGGLQKPPSFKEGQTQQQDGLANSSQQQQDLWSAWTQQFVDAIEYDSKAADGEDEEPGGALGLVLHFFSIFWKLLNALAPPEWWMGGWPCFWVCLVLIIGEVRQCAAADSVD